jgi:hypothetical protein
MTLKQYRSGGNLILYKVVHHNHRGRMVALGIAFRTQDAPIGYFPFFGADDFDFSGETSLREELLARLPINLSAAGSPHSLLIKEAAGDVEFLGSGDGDLTDIQQLVKKDLLRHAMACASGVFVDGIMLALGGPAITSVVGQFTKSKVQQFILSKAISSAAKKHIKEQGRVDVSSLLNHVP